MADLIRGAAHCTPSLEAKGHLRIRLGAHASDVQKLSIARGSIPRVACCDLRPSCLALRL